MSPLWRSVLFVPGTRPDRFANALASGADAVVFDLEDSVEAGRKPDARRIIAEFLTSPSSSQTSRLIRINAVDSAWFDDDLAFVRQMAAMDGIVLPKTETAAHVQAVASAAGSRHVVPLVETARGILNAPAIAMAHTAIPAILFGAEDLTAQLGIARSVDGEELLFARSLVVLAAAAAGVDAIDAVFTDLSSAGDLRQDATRARALGFRGKMAIHPNQIAVIHDVFSPSAADIERARGVVGAYDAALARGAGVIRLDDRMIDAPVVARARRVLAIAERLVSRT
jgi:citrate lyase subunit beta/citryl-CoA lyase